MPQLSLATTVPQFLPRREQNWESDSALQPQTLATPPPPQVWGEAQVEDPQLTVRPMPQLSMELTEPQFLPRRLQNWLFVSPVQPHLLATPLPPQESGEEHVPQLKARLTPQLSVPVN